jgi:hypothetical protein
MMLTRSMAVVGSILTLSASARAQDPAPPTTVTPAPGQAAAAAPAPEATPITANCSLGEHPGVSDAEARTAADILCHELAMRGATGSPYEVRFGSLGGKTLVVLASHKGNTYDERRTLLTGMDEINVASPRLAAALVDGKPLDDTRNVDNVLSSEARRPRTQGGTIGFDGGFFATTGLGAKASLSAGLALGILYRSGSLGVSAQGRAGGIGSDDDKISSDSLDIGARYYMSTSDVSPYIGGGFTLSYFDLSRAGASDVSGSGIGAYGNLGVEFMRSHPMAFTLSARADVPFYALKGDGETRYVTPLSLNVGILLR